MDNLALKILKESNLWEMEEAGEINANADVGGERKAEETVSLHE